MPGRTELGCDHFDNKPCKFLQSSFLFAWRSQRQTTTRGDAVLLPTLWLSCVDGAEEGVGKHLLRAPPKKKGLKESILTNPRDFEVTDDEDNEKLWPSDNRMG
jgi:hypothetical protein